MTFTDVSETTLTLIWRESSIPNGIIDGYSVMKLFFDVSSAETNMLSFFQITYHVGEIADSNTVVSDTESVQLVNLEPFTNYTVTVTCVNAAGPGNSSTPVTTRTNSARKYHTCYSSTFQMNKICVQCIVHSLQHQPFPIIPLLTAWSSQMVGNLVWFSISQMTAMVPLG